MLSICGSSSGAGDAILRVVSLLVCWMSGLSSPMLHRVAPSLYVIDSFVQLGRVEYHRQRSHLSDPQSSVGS